jgi:hypothetical protein
MEEFSFDVLEPDLARVVVAVGSTGTGKSTIINMLFNNAYTKLEMEYPCTVGSTTEPITKGAKWVFSAADSTLYGDTVGFSDPDITDFEIAMNLKKFILTAQGGVNCIIIVLKYGRITREERANLEMISKIFDGRWAENCIIVATNYGGELNEDGELDEEMEQQKIKEWIGTDEEMQAFFQKINRRIILTDTSIGRFEEANRPLRRQSLRKLRKFCNSCKNMVGPAPINKIEVFRYILEKYFGFLRVGRAKERISEILQYISSDNSGEITAGDCPVCFSDVIFSEMAQTHCNHVYHRKCIIDYIIHEKKGRETPCPVCRRAIYFFYSPKGFLQ